VGIARRHGRSLPTASSRSAADPGAQRLTPQPNGRPIRAWPPSAEPAS
jgi:hypothetical protein